MITGQTHEEAGAAWSQLLTLRGVMLSISLPALQGTFGSCGGAEELEPPSSQEVALENFKRLVLRRETLEFHLTALVFNGTMPEGLSMHACTLAEQQ